MGKMRWGCAKCRQVRPLLGALPQVPGSSVGQEGPCWVCPPSPLTPGWWRTLAACWRILGLCLVLWCKGCRGLRTRGHPWAQRLWERLALGLWREQERQMGCRSWMGRLISEPTERSEQPGQEGSGLGQGWRGGRKGWLGRWELWVPMIRSFFFFFFNWKIILLVYNCLIMLVVFVSAIQQSESATYAYISTPS